jgi:hypothetical protein
MSTARSPVSFTRPDQVTLPSFCTVESTRTRVTSRPGRSGSLNSAPMGSVGALENWSSLLVDFATLSAIAC